MLQAEPVWTVGKDGESLGCDGAQATVGCPEAPSNIGSAQGLNGAWKRQWSTEVIFRNDLLPCQKKHIQSAEDFIILFYKKKKQQSHESNMQTNLLEWPKTRTLTIPNAGRKVELIHSGILIHCWFPCKTVQPLWKTVSPYTTECTLAMQSNNLASWCLPKGTENLYPH